MQMIAVLEINGPALGDVVRADIDQLGAVELPDVIRQGKRQLEIAEKRIAAQTHVASGRGSDADHRLRIRKIHFPIDAAVGKDQLIPIAHTTPTLLCNI